MDFSHEEEAHPYNVYFQDGVACTQQQRILVKDMYLSTAGIPDGYTSKREWSAYSPQDAVSGADRLNTERRGKYDVGHKIEIVERLEEGLYSARWVVLFVGARKLSQREREKYRLHTDRRVQETCRVKCGGQMHTIAVVGGSLVLCNHPPDELRAEMAIRTLGDSEELYGCLKVREEWRKFDYSGVPYGQRLMPKKLIELRKKCITSHRGRRRPRGSKYCATVNNQRPAPWMFRKEAWHKELTDDAIRKLAESSVGEAVAKVAPALTSKLHIVDAHGKDLKYQTYSGFTFEINFRSWWFTVYRRNLVLVEDCLLFTAERRDDDLLDAYCARICDRPVTEEVIVRLYTDRPHRILRKH